MTAFLTMAAFFHHVTPGKLRLERIIPTALVLSQVGSYEQARNDKGACYE